MSIIENKTYTIQCDVKECRTCDTISYRNSPPKGWFLVERTVTYPGYDNYYIFPDRYVCPTCGINKYKNSGASTYIVTEF